MISHGAVQGARAKAGFKQAWAVFKCEQRAFGSGPLVFPAFPSFIYLEVERELRLFPTFNCGESLGRSVLRGINF